MLFHEYDFRITLLEPMLGTVPKDPEIYKNYIASKSPSSGGAPSPERAEEEVETVKNAVKRVIFEKEKRVPTDEELAEEIKKLELSGWTGFHEDEHGIFIYDYLFLGFLKEAGNVLAHQLGVKSLRSKIDQYVFVEPRRIYLAKVPAGHIERPLRGMTMQGPRVTLVRSDYVPAGTTFDVTVKILDNQETAKSQKVDRRVLLEIMEYGQFRALGQFRNGGYGRISYELLAERETEYKSKYIA